MPKPFNDGLKTDIGSPDNIKTATFNRFPDLPTELRIQIWELVIRENRPGVHIFSHCDQALICTPESRAMVARGLCGWTFSEPSPLHYFDSVKRDVPRKNVSTYLIDGGMWTACKESRFIMEAHFRQTEWIRSRSISEEERHSRVRAMSKETRFNLPSTGNFFGSPLHQLTVIPHRDLFVLQVDRLDNVHWESIGFDWSFGWGVLGYEGIHHVAIEFNPDWWDSDEGEWDRRNLRTLINAAFDAYNPVDTIWIIDHNLKRRNDAPTFEDKSDNAYNLNAFYASDRKLLQVDLKDLGHWTDPSTGLPPSEYPWEENNCSLNFAELLRDDIDFELDGRTDDPRTGMNACSIGILGWDDL